MVSRHRIYEIVEKGKDNDKASKAFDLFIYILIILSIVSIIVESFLIRNIFIIKFLYYFGMFSTISFTIEYILRLVTADFKCPKKNMFLSIIFYIITPMAIIDLLSILPFYIPMLIPVDLRFLRSLRLFRVLRVLKLSRYSKSLDEIKQVIKNKKYELIMTLSLSFILILIASILMYYIESSVQPESFPNILASAWWAIVTLTTIGY